MSGFGKDDARTKSWVGAMLHDAHFWVPLAVLLGGLLLLRAIQ